ncbi:uncharacterized protein [Anabrus simplex]|uniref:uncharacterized protein isoform X1 n=1 Tax=Anabrus simplex TaxID=316456 RepID=UPI0035A28991
MPTMSGPATAPSFDTDNIAIGHDDDLILNVIPDIDFVISNPENSTSSDTGLTLRELRCTPPDSLTLPPSCASEENALPREGFDPLADTDIIQDPFGDNQPGEEDNIAIDVDDKSPLDIHVRALDAILQEGISHNNWQSLRKVTEDAQLLVKIPVHQGDYTQKKKDPENPKYIQSLYRINRRKAMRLILGDEGRRCNIDNKIVTQHFRETAKKKSNDLSDFNSRPSENTPYVNTARISPYEVQSRLQKCENSAPGDDRLTYKHWNMVDPACTLPARIFNICMKYEKIPSDWKQLVTILLFKKGVPHDITNWRPIAIMRTIYKLYSGVLAKRMTTWMIDNKILAPAQKGFIPHDGVFEQLHAQNKI